MSPWVFYVYMDAVMKEVEMGMGRMKMRLLEERGDCLVSCMQLTWFCVVSQGPEDDDRMFFGV